MAIMSVVGNGRSRAALLAIVGFALAVPCTPPGDPFAILDRQDWVNPDDMVSSDFIKPPGTNWSDPSRRGSSRNFNIALVAVDYPDDAGKFIVTQPPESTIFGNPQPVAANIPRSDVPAFYRDLLNKPSKTNDYHTLHEYWMEDSAGLFGVDLTAFGAYQMPFNSWQYGIDDRFNPGACPVNQRCNLNIRTDALGAWRAAVGNETADSFELVFILSAGQDESSTWQEFGPMRWASPEDVPPEFGPPVGNGTNYATTRYVPWTSFAAAATLWSVKPGPCVEVTGTNTLSGPTREAARLLRVKAAEWASTPTSSRISSTSPTTTTTPTPSSRSAPTQDLGA
jgi:M6 family metalloprotease-like protein